MSDGPQHEPNPEALPDVSDRHLVWTVLVEDHARNGIAALPESALFAVMEFITGPLSRNPRRVGSPLTRPPFDGVYRARRGEYRILYDVDWPELRVVVRRVAHRRTVYDRVLPRRPD